LPSGRGSGANQLSELARRHRKRITTAVLLGLAAATILLIIWAQVHGKAKTRYACNSAGQQAGCGECTKVESEDAGYDSAHETEEDCMAVCGATDCSSGSGSSTPVTLMSFACSGDGSCVQSTSGTYETEALCLASCPATEEQVPTPAPPPTPTPVKYYVCTSGRCAETSSPGEYTSRSQCEAACGGGTTTGVSKYAEIPMRGVNLAGAEYDSGFQLPPASSADQYVAMGMNTVRLPFKWEYFVAPDVELDTANPVPASTPIDFDGNANAAAYRVVVNELTARGITVVLDMHNYMRYDGKIIGSGDAGAATAADYAAAWASIASVPEWANNPLVVFGLMNEPNEMSSWLMLDNYNAALDAIRATGADNLALLDGNLWSGAHAWGQGDPANDNPKISNADLLVPGNLTANAGDYAVDVHQYFDSDYSGLSKKCTAGKVIDVSALLDYLAETGTRAFVGEFGGDNNATCAEDIDRFLRDTVDANPSLFIGWTGWVGGDESNRGTVGLTNYFDDSSVTMKEGYARHLTPP